jgi:hypothetical protein
MKPFNLLLASPFTSVFEGTVEGYPDAYIPELWANESIAILEENMVLGNLVHRDFEPLIAAYGDVVNTRKPGEFIPMRKTAADSVTVQTPTATSVPVVLNQHLHTSFIIKDGDQSLAFKDLVTEYLHPAMLSIARGIDQILSSQVYQFLPNVAGHLNSISGTTAQEALLGTRQVMNVNKAYVQNRNLVLGTVSETALLSDKDFTQAFAVGDQGTALREANLGRKFGFDIFMAQNQPYTNPALTDQVKGAVNNGPGYAAGVKSFTVDGFSAAISVGSWISIVGDDTPLQVTGTTGGSTPTVITTSQSLKTAVVDDAVVVVWGVGAVNLSGGYATGYAKPIVYDTFTQDPQVGQGVTFNSSTILYGVIQVDTIGKTILLDRPLEEVNGIANNDAINLLPSGSYNLGFHRNALTLVTRPLALPMPGTGARAGVANFGGLSMRVTMTYDGNKQGTLVTLDTLLGVKVLDQKLGAILLG